MVNYFSIYLGMTIIYHTFTCLNASQRRVNELEAVFSGPRAEVWRKVVNFIGEISEKPGFIWIYMDLTTKIQTVICFPKKNMGFT